MTEVILREAKAVIAHGESRKCQWAQGVPEEGKEELWVLEKGREGKQTPEDSSLYLVIHGIQIEDGANFTIPKFVQSQETKIGK